MTITSLAQAEYKDTIIHKDGSIFVSKWKKNQAQDSQGILTARLYANEVGISGIQYMALGSGLVAWDITPPTPEVAPLLTSSTTLLAEVSRVPVNLNSFRYLNPDTDALITDGSKTRKIEFSVDIQNEFIEGFDLREFALFGGNATNVADSGYMINWFTHDVISVSGDRIIRTVRIKWLTLDEARAL